MRVSLTFFGILRDQVGQKTLGVDLPQGSVVSDLIEAIAPVMEQTLAGWAWDAERRSFSSRVVVSRRGEAGSRDLTAALVDGEEILVLPPIAGG